MAKACSTTSAKEVWRGRDNPILLRLDRTSAEGVTSPTPLSDVVKMTLKLTTGQSVTSERNVIPAEIDWWDTDLDTGEVKLTLGKWVEQENIKAGNYTGVLILYGPVTPNGVVWSEDKPNLFFKVLNT